MMLAHSFTVTVVLALFVHCLSACIDTVYVSTNGGSVAISKDGGNTWSTVLSNVGVVHALSANGNNVYAATDKGLAVSHDGGVSWSIKNLQTSPGCNPSTVSVFVAEDKRVYALVGVQIGCPRVAISSDNGDTWPVNLKLPNPPFRSGSNIDVDGSRIYVATADGLGFSDNTGGSWTFKNQASGLGANGVECVIGKGQTIYAGLIADGGPVSMSKNDGVNWNTVNTTPTGLADLVRSMFLKGDTLYVATFGGGLSWSSDFTTWTWKTTRDGLAANTTTSIVASGNNLYLGTINGLSISRNKGQNWITKTTADGLPNDWITAMFAQCV